MSEQEIGTDQGESKVSRRRLRWPAATVAAAVAVVAATLGVAVSANASEGSVQASVIVTCTPEGNAEVISRAVNGTDSSVNVTFNGGTPVSVAAGETVDDPWDAGQASIGSGTSSFEVKGANGVITYAGISCPPPDPSVPPPSKTYGPIELYVDSDPEQQTRFEVFANCDGIIVHDGYIAEPNTTVRISAGGYTYFDEVIDEVGDFSRSQPFADRPLTGVSIPYTVEVGTLVKTGTIAECDSGDPGSTTSDESTSDTATEGTTSTEYTETSETSESSEASETSATSETTETSAMSETSQTSATSTTDESTDESTSDKTTSSGSTTSGVTTTATETITTGETSTKTSIVTSGVIATETSTIVSSATATVGPPSVTDTVTQTTTATATETQQAQLETNTVTVIAGNNDNDQAGSSQYSSDYGHGSLKGSFIPGPAAAGDGDMVASASHVTNTSPDTGVRMVALILLGVFAVGLMGGTAWKTVRGR